MSLRAPRLVVDLHACQTRSARRGIGRYSASFAKALAARGGESRFSLNGVRTESFPELAAMVGSDRVDRTSLQWHTGIGMSPDSPEAVLQARYLAEHYSRLNADVVHVSSHLEWELSYPSPRQLGASVASATLYDLVPLLFSEAYLDPVPDLKQAYLRKMESFREYDLLLAISNSARRDAMEHLGIDAERVVCIGGACGLEFRPLSLSAAQRDQVHRQFDLKLPFVLYTTGDDFRKNNEFAIRGFAALPEPVRSAHILLFVSSSMRPEEAVRLRGLAESLGLADHFRILDSVPDPELVLLYNACRLFVFPSLYEGFGLPPLEAMSCGAPTIVADTSSLPEIVNRADARFDPRRPESMTRLMYDVLSQGTFRETLCQWSLVRARDFSWENCARSAHDAWREALARKAHTASRSAQHKRQPTIFLDVWLYAHQAAEGYMTGIQRVVSNLILAAGRQSARDVRLAYEADNRAEPRICRPPALGHSGFTEESCEMKPGDIYLLPELRGKVFRYSPFPQALERVGVQKIALLYDLLPLRRPELFPPHLVAEYAEYFDVLIREFDGIVCISRAVADELIGHVRAGHWPAGRSRTLRIGYFPLGFLPQPEAGGAELGAAVADFFSRPDPVVLMVGTLEPRKAYAQALDAMERLWQRGSKARLCIVGRVGWDVRSIQARLAQHAEKGRRLLHLQEASDAELAHCYRNSSGLLYASMGEGFGLPLVEAAHFGLPLLVRDLAVFREVCGASATYFADDRASPLAAALDAFLAGVADGSVTASRSVRAHSWSESLEALLAVLDGNWYSTIEDPSASAHGGSAAAGAYS